MRVHLQAFADDLLMVGHARTIEELEEKVHEALSIVSRWGVKSKMAFSAQKTQVVLLTRKLRYRSPDIIFNGEHLNLSPTLKVLGLVIDNKLNFVPHIKEVTAKAIGIYRKTSRAARATWGLNTTILKRLYTMLVEPVILYAASAWADRADNKNIRKRLDHITRIFAIRISKTHRTVSLVSAALLAGILPLHLRAQERLSLHHIRLGGPVLSLPGRPAQRPIDAGELPHPAYRKILDFGIVETQEAASNLHQPLALYTDGSKIEDKVGAAVSVWRADKEVLTARLRLAEYCTVYQAELCALSKALEMIVRRPGGSQYNICSDSRSALMAIRNPDTLNPWCTKLGTLLWLQKPNRV